MTKLNTTSVANGMNDLAKIMIDSSLDMMIAVDDDNGIMVFNKAAREKFGYSEEEVIGLETSVLYADPDQLNKVKTAMSEKGSFAGEVVNRTKSGETFLVFLSATRIYNDQGEQVGAMGVSRDITRVKAEEKHALEQAAKINAIFQSSSKMMMWTLDGDLQITSSNDSFKRILRKGLGLDLNEGDAFIKVMQPFVADGNFEKYHKKYKKALVGVPQEFETEMFNRRGDKIWVETILNPIKIEGVGIREISCVAREITDKKRAVIKLRSSLREKDVLLQEVHHRVKNNLQVISSILNLQSGQIEDQRILDLLKQSQDRIRSMSYVHESLYQNKNFSFIDLSDYVLGLTRNLMHSYVNGRQITLSTKLGHVELDLDQAVPCGLLLNEMITNSLKYAFPEGKEGELNIEVGEEDGKVILKVGDNGIGLPKGLGLDRVSTLGLQLVNTLVDQLDGSIELEPKSGTNYLVTFDRIR